jgi:hypothetical protein
LSNTSIWPFFDATCQAVHPYLSLAENIFFNSSCVTTYLAHSQSLFNTSIWP